MMMAFSNLEGATIMLINVSESILWQFRSCFSRKAAFDWFVIVVMAFIIRCDHTGVSSVIRWLFLNPDYYDPLLRFFRTTSWQLEPLLASWVSIAMSSFPIPEFNGRPLLIGDTIKVGKEAHKMPALKLLHQESQNSCTSEFVFGHHFGVVGLLVGSRTKSFCLPLQAEIHEGIDAIRPAEGLDGKPATLVTRMAHLLVEKARQTGRCCYATVDAYYSVGPMFSFLKTALDENGRQWVHVITRAKSNYVGFFNWPGSTKKYQKKDKVPLADIFDFPNLFQKAELTIRGKLETVEYFCIDLLWQPVKDCIRFVLVVDGKDRFILMCSDLDLSPQEIITIYRYRSNIEGMFLFLKHLLGGFRYRFWTKVFPELKRNEKLDLSKLSKPDLLKIRRTVQAIERHVNLAAIALGLLQHLALTQAAKVWSGYHGWLRTYSSALPSEAVVQNAIRAEFFTSMQRKVPVCRTLQIILERGRDTELDQVA
jgi:hypothetical protein